ncbi:indole-3-glycerol phosphate synthase [Insulibacter thermoxylanivorax]|uniref:Indole-3-glycerol phosphate synthase n=1 Tax=Insulibacter thermoxylanivorax TaxID=2749268 RepID=A0A916VEL1_9BACL|nr:indole-3-glycerol phosphate synthase TrpC [Insulibacter thermoxylanivorax]GFR36893.1 indole-3-glycerol phosphate synthase [Insulibacter thermoxylanivorax]
MYLDKIVITKREEVERLRTTLHPAEAERRIAELAPCRGFAEALSAGKRHRSMGLIAEVKKASPSKGLIRPDFNPVQLARTYEAAGADCISVLTDEVYFQGANEYLTEICRAVDRPLLRKDFIIDPLQIYEARLIGADAVLLIAAILSKQQIREYLQMARDLGMDALIEVHSREELEMVLELDGVSLIGVNNRNLHTFEVDLEHTRQLIDLMPKDVTIVSESGIASPQDIQWLASIGADAVLIGEYFMRQDDVAEAVHQLMGRMPA